MAFSSIFLAEEALSLPPEQRAELAKLLTESLREDRRSDEEIRTDLQRRFADLKSGKDKGLSFEQTFGSKA
jgi:putative addiction module component (TIGR02574 family)